VSAVEEDRAEGLRFKMMFASSQCSDEECSNIVLRHGSVCKNPNSNPNSECSEHVTTCKYCDGKMCEDCMLDESICKGCGKSLSFQCNYQWNKSLPLTSHLFLKYLFIESVRRKPQARTYVRLTRKKIKVGQIFGLFT
jgi:hypothetical protein